MLIYCTFVSIYPTVIASFGQESAHVAQSVHFSSSTLAFSFSRTIADTGQSSTHIPQPTQSSIFTFAVIISPFRYISMYLFFYTFVFHCLSIFLYLCFPLFVYFSKFVYYTIEVLSLSKAFFITINKTSEIPLLNSSLKSSSYSIS
jgi:hypothetical protein